MMLRFAKKEANRKILLECDLKQWLTGWLEESFNYREERELGTWAKAKDWDEEAVREIMRIEGLNEKGYVVAGMEEMNYQIRWRREEDWRAGSEPLGRPSRIDIAEEKTCFQRSQQIGNLTPAYTTTIQRPGSRIGKRYAT